MDQYTRGMGEQLLVIKHYVAKFRVRKGVVQNAYLWMAFMEQQQKQFLVAIKGRNYVITRHSLKIEADGHAYMYLFGREEQFHEAIDHQQPEIAKFYEAYWEACLETGVPVVFREEWVSGHGTSKQPIPNIWFVPHEPTIVAVDIVPFLRMAS